MSEGIACPVEADIKVALAMIMLKQVASSATVAELVGKQNAYTRPANAHPRHLPNRLIPEIARVLQRGYEIGAPNRLWAGFPGANPMGRSGLPGHYRGAAGRPTANAATIGRTRLVSNALLVRRRPTVEV
jgi:hypothetical protein